MTLLFQGNESSKTYGFPDGVQAKDPSRYGIVPDPLGVYPNVWHVQVRPGDNNVAGSGSGERCEGLITTGTVGPQVRGIEGRELFFAWDVVFGSGYAPNAAGWNNVGQWHNSGTTGATCAIVTPSDKMVLNVAPGNSGNYDAHDTGLTIKTLSRYELAFRWLWSEDKTKGGFAMWRDGAVVFPFTHTATLDPGQTTYPKLGNYRTAQNFVGDFYFHGYRIATTLAEAIGGFTKSAHAAGWAAIVGGVTPPPVSKPIHDAVDAYGVSLDTADLLRALHLIADKVEP